MASFNRVILLGNLTRDIEVRYLQSGMAVADIGMAVNDRRKRQNGERIEERTVYCTMNAAGGFGFSFARPFAQPPRVVWSIGNAVAGMVPVAGVLTNGITTSRVDGVSCNAMTGQALTDGWFHYIAIGPDPGI